MINQRNVSAKSLVVNIFKKIPAILGCLPYVFSFISPFYYVEFYTAGGGGSTNYWSYRDDYEAAIGIGVFHRNQYWLVVHP